DPIGMNRGLRFSDRAAGESLTPRVMLDRGAERVRKEFKDQPLLLAALLAAIGNAYRSMGLFPQAEPLLVQALDLRPDAGEVERAESQCDLAWLRHDRGDYDEAERLYHQALDLRVKNLPEDDPLLATTRFNLAWLLTDMGETEEPERLFRSVAELRRRKLPAD